MSIALSQPKAVNKKYSPFYGLCWSFFNSRRSTRLSIAKYTLLLILLVHIFPGLNIHELETKTPFSFAVACKFLAVVSILGSPSFCLLFLIGLGTGASYDITRQGMGYPPHSLRTPVSSIVLASWLIVFGMAAVVLEWLIVDALILTPMGFPVPYLVSSLWLAVISIGIQVLAWFPFGSQAFRAILISLFFPAVALTAMASYSGIPNRDIALTIPLGLIALFWPIACNAVARERRGDSLNWEWLALSFRRKARICDTQPFNSSMTAQIWKEWRGHGMFMPLMVAVMNTLMLISLIPGSGEHYPVDTFTPHSPILDNIMVSGASIVPYCVFIPLWLVGFSGGATNPQDVRDSKGALSAYLATRPLSTLEMVIAKLKMMVKTTLISWACLIPVTVIWLMKPASSPLVSGPLGVVLLHYVTGRECTALCCVLAALIFVTWIGQANGIFCTILSRYLGLRIIQRGAPMLLLVNFVIVATFFASPTCASFWIAAAHYLVPTAVVIKAALMYRVCLSLIQYRLIDTKTLKKIAVWWTIVASVFFAAFASFIPSAIVPMWELAGIVVLIMPGVQLALAPLVLDLSRHE